ncbi:hypothetical protein CH354_05455 [Leptospira levettii]|nr:hypothetical protein CH354_05455 [Leptospira levettii]PJZ89464.1 hypothetical protein CH368_06315 [Leptospira levettii]PKA01982.1 hypothetical protein CH369_02025 [Leptospira levettii]
MRYAEITLNFLSGATTDVTVGGVLVFSILFLFETGKRRQKETIHTFLPSTDHFIFFVKSKLFSYLMQ